MKIVSLIASATEIVCALGLRENLVGISHECDYPPHVMGLPVLSEPRVDPHLPSADIDAQVRRQVASGLSVYQVKTDVLEQLQPDVIVTQDQCEVCAVSLADVEAAVCSLLHRPARICTLHPDNLEDVCRDFLRVAEDCGVPERGRSLVAEFRDRMQRLRAHTENLARPRVACVEWLQPLMIAGGWMPELVRIAGGEPILVTDAEHFRTVTWEQLQEAQPDVIVVMPCGFTVERSLQELATIDHPLRRCWVADGNAYFNRPGPRLADSAELLASILHPQAFSARQGAVQWANSEVR